MEPDSVAYELKVLTKRGKTDANYFLDFILKGFFFPRRMLSEGELNVVTTKSPRANAYT